MALSLHNPFSLAAVKRVTVACLALLLVSADSPPETAPLKALPLTMDPGWDPFSSKTPLEELDRKVLAPWDSVLRIFERPSLSRAQMVTDICWKDGLMRLHVRRLYQGTVELDYASDFPREKTGKPSEPPSWLRQIDGKKEPSRGFDGTDFYCQFLNAGSAKSFTLWSPDTSDEDPVSRDFASFLNFVKGQTGIECKRGGGTPVKLK